MDTDKQKNVPVIATPKDFFFQIGVIATLYISAISLVTLLYQLINYAFPDALSYYGDPFSYSTSMRIAIASLIVVFPTYIFLGRHLQKDYITHPEKRHFSIRKILVYLTLFLAAGFIIGDLIALINNFLGGETTIRFILKVISILVVAGLIFGYYITDLKKPEHSEKNVKIFTIIASVLIIGSIVLGFFVTGSPKTQRLLRLDQNKVNDLQNIQWQIVNFWQQKGKLPQILPELEDSISGFIVPIDTQSGNTYEYKILGLNSFNLCAEFNLESREVKIGQGSVRYKPNPVPELFGQDVWEHKEGLHCFERKIDPNLYPTKNNF